MAYGQNNGGYRKPAQQKSEINNVSSTGVTFYNEEAGKFMNINYCGRNMAIEIGTCPNGVPFTWETRKAAQIFSQVISFNAIADLAYICEEVSDSIKANGTFTPVGFRAGSKKDCVIEISNGENIHMPTGIYLVIYKGLDNGNRTNVIEFYPFDSTKLIRGYDHNSGQLREDICKVGEFKKFRKVVDAATDAFTMAQAHTVCEIKKNDKLSMFKALAAMSASMGVDLTEDLMGKKSSGAATYTRNSDSAPSGGGYQRRSYGGNNGGGYQRSGGGYQRGSYVPRGNNGGQTPSGGQRTFESAPRQQSTLNQYQQTLNAMADEPVDINIDMNQLQSVSLSDFTNGGN